jgi:hypothetical protein
MTFSNKLFTNYTRIVRWSRFILVGAWLGACLYLLAPAFVTNVSLPKKRSVSNFATKGTNITYVMANGDKKVTIRSEKGRFRNQDEIDLKGNVMLRTQDGTTLFSRNVHLNLNTKTAHGNEPVAGRGPLGTLKAQGFRLDDAGEVFHLRGPSTLIIDAS